jgi:hypothetical protein
VWLVGVVLVVMGAAWVLERHLCPSLGRRIRQLGSPKPR